MTRRRCAKRGRGCIEARGRPRLAVGHTETGTMADMYGIGLLLVLVAPWLVAIGWVWSRAPRDDSVPPSMGERALQRLTTV